MMAPCIYARREKINMCIDHFYIFMWAEGKLSIVAMSQHKWKKDWECIGPRDYIYPEEGKCSNEMLTLN